MNQYTTLSFSQFVDWFRSASPYIHAHHGRTFVISMGGEALETAHFKSFIHDIALLSSLDIRIILVYGVRPQVERQLISLGKTPQYVDGIRITDEVGLQCVKAACGEVGIAIQSYLSMGLANSPKAGEKIRVVSGNFIMAKPLGVRQGVDYGYTGEVRQVDAAAIIHHLQQDAIVLISPIGYSPSGEVFNLLAEEIAMAIATTLHAAKWICMTNIAGLVNERGRLVRQLTVLEAQRWLAQLTDFNCRNQLIHAVQACQKGVERVHLISHQQDGSLLLELFSRDGSGTLISYDAFEHIRKATFEDIAGLLSLLQPLEETGILVRRSREKLETEINHFTVQERDGMIIGCAALYPYLEEKTAELACLVVHPQYRQLGKGDALLTFLEREAFQLGIRRIFVLTTQTAHWFQERGYQLGYLSELPIARQMLYNYQRNSKIFIKLLV